MKEFDVQTLFYDAGKADPEIVTMESLYKGVIRAHDNSNIGQISNSLTKVWNKADPDRHAADLLCCYNNAMIDGAKTGWVNSYEYYPEANKRINKAIGGKRSNMPFFFQFTKNGRRNEGKDRKKFAMPTKSTMNRIANKFDDIKKVNFNVAKVEPFNWQMLLANNNDDYNYEAAELFCEINESNFTNIIRAHSVTNEEEYDNVSSARFIKELIEDVLINRFGSLETVYSSVVKYLFVGDALDKVANKQMFWMVFGHIACRNIKHNMEHYHVCNNCGAKIPDWAVNHVCIEKAVGITTCIDCGKIIKRSGPRTCRCRECKIQHRETYTKQYMDGYFQSKQKKGWM